MDVVIFTTKQEIKVILMSVFQQPTRNKKIKFNQRHWLNLIIFLISMMLLLSLFISRMMSKPVSPNSELLNVKASGLSVAQPITSPLRIRQIDFGELQFNKIENDWVTSNNLTKEELLIIVENWQSLLSKSGTAIEQPIKSGKTVLIYLNDIKSPIIAKLGLMNNELRISFINQKQEFSFPVAEFNFYYPEAE